MTRINHNTAPFVPLSELEEQLKPGTLVEIMKEPPWWTPINPSEFFCVMPSRKDEPGKFHFYDNELKTTSWPELHRARLWFDVPCVHEYVDIVGESIRGAPLVCRKCKAEGYQRLSLTTADVQRFCTHQWQAFHASDPALHGIYCVRCGLKEASAGPGPQPVVAEWSEPPFDALNVSCQHQYEPTLNVENVLHSMNRCTRCGDEQPCSAAQIEGMISCRQHVDQMLQQKVRHAANNKNATVEWPEPPFAVPILLPKDARSIAPDDDGKWWMVCAGPECEPYIIRRTRQNKTVTLGAPIAEPGEDLTEAYGHWRRDLQPGDMIPLWPVWNKNFHGMMESLPWCHSHDQLQSNLTKLGYKAHLEKYRLALELPPVWVKK